MHGTIPAASSPARRAGLPLVLRLALRELRAGLAGFFVFIACIALGVGAISGVASIARSLVEGVASQGRTILGGDATFALIQREATPEERAALAARGSVATVATLRAMAVTADGAALVEAKAVDASYPTRGTLETDPPVAVAELLAERDGAWGAVADPVLFERLDLKPGARVTIGTAAFELRARLVSEPDKIANGIGFGPRLIMSQDALRASGLLQPGSLVRWSYRVSLPPGRDTDEDLSAAVEAVAKAVPEAGWDVRTRLNADPRFTNNILRFSQFLTLVGLTALLVGGVGVANAVTAFVDRKRNSVGILKSLGATGGTVIAVFLVQVMAIALIGIALGLAVGAALLFGTAALAGSVLPLPITPTLAPADLATAVLYGLLTALAFSILPLGRAHDISVSGLFRDRIAPDRRWPRPRYMVAAAVAGLALTGLAVLAAQDRRVALIFVGAALFAFVLLRLVAEGVMAAARRLPHPRHPSARLALANLHRPGALTPSLVLSLGLGIALLVTIAVIDRNLSRELNSTLPERAPNFFFIDVPSTETEAFGRFLAEKAPGAALEAVPMMRGRLTSLKGVPVGEVKAAQEVAWVLDGDRGITYSRALPEGSSLVAGEWWPADYRGPPLVSFDAQVAEGLGLAIGDSVTVNVLGRSLTARIANLRKVDWRRLGINFVMVFSPNTFTGAPHTELMTITLPRGADPALEPRLLRDVARAFPSVTSVRVKDALEAFNEIVGQLLFAIRIASSVALLASVLVLAGALAAGHRARVYDAVILKTLGATRPKLVLAYAIEYGALGLATALFGLVAGSAAAFFVITRVMKLGFSPDLGPAAAWALAAVFVAVGLGLAGTWRILGQKPARYLRSSE
ncbi:ABC transporter permease [Enterovirga aerilata]|uniref:ABC transporter permease n=1 Tax=Enterovirga aerilata TaxID=2730920 RepID=A0A849IAR5_9HYPH|nr:ABC transporter permease [Enterovirga sp. DB1703]NNM71043.1 ABC transporter permease [Enterovirga sp. DB1703]